MLVTFMTAAEVVYLLVLSGWILLEKRSPVATVAWILALAALPVVGFVLYFFFGPRRLRRKRSRHAAARERVRKRVEEARKHHPRETRPANAEQLIRLGYEVGGDPPSSAEQVQVITSGVDCYARICRSIDEAREHVHVLYYIFEPGEAGQRLLDAMIAAAERGVEVRLLVDAIGSFGAPRRWLRTLQAAGGEVAQFNPGGLPRVRTPINFRNHRKIVVCDGVVGFTGGMNVCDDYVVERGGCPPWRDTHLELRGNVVRWLQLMFFDDWEYATHEAPHGQHYFPPPASGEPHTLQVIPGGPDQDHEPIRNVYFTAIANSRERVWVTTPYFVPDESVLTALTTAAMRGVDVRVLVPRNGDSRIVSAAIRSYYDEVIAAGVQVYEYLPTVLHSKTMVVDGNIAVIGTANLDNRSFRLNFELLVLLYGEEHASIVAAQFEDDLQHAEAITARTLGQVGALDRLGEASARLLSPVL